MRKCEISFCRTVFYLNFLFYILRLQPICLNSIINIFQRFPKKQRNKENNLTSEYIETSYLFLYDRWILHKQMPQLFLHFDDFQKTLDQRLKLSDF